VLAGNPRAVAQLITRLERDAPDAFLSLKSIFHATGTAYVLGITGAPGVGKSTLVDGLVRQARAAGLSIGVLAVDPSSPFTGGAILGDRIRMQGHAHDAGVFIRSMGARGQLGGLARATRKAIHVLDAAGYAIVVVETVGVGQSELDIASAADSTIVVVTPGMGDTIQTLKAGILEIADIFVLNKADQEGARQTLRSLQSMLHMGPAGDWDVPIVETRAHDAVGLDALWETIVRHRAYLEESGALADRRAARLKAEVLNLVERGLRTDILEALLVSPEYAAVVRSVVARARDPEDGAHEILQGVDARPERILLESQGAGNA
jgi:LAO/AO transport system kinase